MKYVMAEVFSGKLMELEEDKYTERREKVYTFMKIPREFEKVILIKSLSAEIKKFLLLVLQCLSLDLSHLSW